MEEDNTLIADRWPFDLSRIGTWFYFLILGFPISVVLLLVDSFYIPFTDKPIFIDKLPKYSMGYNRSRSQLNYYTRTPAQKVILGFVGFILGIIILVFSLIMSIFGAFKQAAELQESVVLILFPDILKSDQQDQTKETETEMKPTHKTTEQTITCPACGEINPSTSQFCISCGSSLPAKNI
ncbi:MAG: zinc ribbon domain-containing protein [Candidatus Kariarchaeaceae archaeon]|jgi:hypothetical protein